MFHDMRCTYALAALVTLVTAMACTSPARALDKQGSAHGGSVDARDTGFDASGNLLLGSALYNPSYAARPDNTGLTLFRYGAHADIDLVGRRLSIPIDVNTFTDRERGGLLVFVPSELDFIGGLTSTWGLGSSALEFGVRYERDMPVDRGGLVQQYADARARYLFSLAEELGLSAAETNEDLRGWLTLGGFLFNPTYPARPDNTGRALLRYGAHVDVQITKLFAVSGDGTFFTDRMEKNPIAPSELDVTAGLLGHFGKIDAMLAYERDMPIDRGGLVQHFVYLTLSVPIDANLDKNRPNIDPSGPW